SIPATTKQRWVARPCGACKGAGFSGVSTPRGCGGIRKEKEKEVGSRSLIPSRPRCGRVRDDRRRREGEKRRRKAKAAGRKGRRYIGEETAGPSYRLVRDADEFG